MLLLALTTFAASTFNANAAKNAAFPTTNEVAQPTNTQAVVVRTAFIIGGQKVTFFQQDDYPLLVKSSIPIGLIRMALIMAMEAILVDIFTSLLTVPRRSTNSEVPVV